MGSLRPSSLPVSPSSLPCTRRFPLFLGWRNQTAQTMLGGAAGEGQHRWGARPVERVMTAEVLGRHLASLQLGLG